MNTYIKGIEEESRMLQEILSSLGLYGIFDPLVITDVSYLSSSGKYAQIDAILICTNGIFCIEFKSWAGEIFASPSREWLVRKPRHQIYYGNPVYQNGKHRAVIDALLMKNIKSYGPHRIKSVVIFSNESLVRNNVNGSKNKLYKNVITAHEAPRYFVDNKDETLMTLDEQLEIYDYLTYLAKAYKDQFKKQQNGIASVR